MKERLLQIILFPLYAPILLIMAIMYVCITTAEDYAYLKSKMQELEGNNE